MHTYSSTCSRDYVQLYFGTSLNSGDVIRYGGLSDGRICERRFRYYKLFASSECLTLFYRTDGSNSQRDARGLEAKVTCIGESYTALHFSIHYHFIVSVCPTGYT